LACYLTWTTIQALEVWYLDFYLDLCFFTPLNLGKWLKKKKVFVRMASKVHLTGSRSWTGLCWGVLPWSFSLFCEFFFFVQQVLFYCLSTLYSVRLRGDSFIHSFVGLLVAVLLGINISHYCRWCRYIDCIPYKRWSCNDLTSSCEV